MSLDGHMAAGGRLRATTLLFIAFVVLAAPNLASAQSASFTRFDSGAAAPVLTPGPPGAWDEFLREKVTVLEENGLFKMWYVGHTAAGQQTSKVGYATSTNGINWTKHPSNPIVSRSTQDQDISVVRTATGTYHMYIEVNNSWIDLLTSTDGINWAASASNPAKTVAASPVVWREGSNWFMLYEDMHPPVMRIHLATSSNGITWTDSPSNPVLADSSEAIPDSVVKDGTTYHLYYHRGDLFGFPAWHATSTNLTTWTSRERLMFSYSSQFTFRAADGRILSYLWNLDGDQRYYLRYGVDLPVAYNWRFDDGSGITAAESSTSGYLGVLVGGPAWTSGRVGGALQFDGADDHILTSFARHLPAWTIACWVRGNAAPSSGPASGPVSRADAFQINWNHPDAAFRGAAALSVNGNFYAASFGPLAGNQWYHLTATYDGETLRTYRDGVPVTTNTSPSGEPVADSALLTIGRNAIRDYFFAGAIDDVRLYGRALGAGEVQALVSPDPTPPSTVTLSAAAVGQTVQLSWTAASDPQSGIAAYRIYRATVGGTAKPMLTEVSGAVTSYVDTAVSPSTRYYYQVSAVNGVLAEGARSNEASAQPTNSPPAAPTGLVATAANQLVALDWQNNTDADLAGYHVRRRVGTTGSFVQITTTLLTSSAYNDTTVSNGVTYYYVVVAVDTASNVSGVSNQVNATPASIDPALIAFWPLDESSGTMAPDQAGAAHGTLQNGPLWTSGRVNGALQFDGINDFVQTPFATNLTNWTVAVWVRSPAAPSAAASSGPVHRNAAFQFNWNHPEPSFRGAVGLMANGNWYSASFGALAADVWYQLVATYDGETLRAYRDGALISSNGSPSGAPALESAPLTLGRHAVASGNFFTGTVDEVRIYSRALSATEVAALTAVDATPPTTVTTSAAPAGQNIQVSWTAASDPESGISQYRIYRGVVSTSKTLLAQVSGSSLSHLDSATAPGTTYFYDVEAVNGAGIAGAHSNTASAVPTNAPPAAPTGLSASSSNGQVSLDWANNVEADLAGYHVHRSNTSGGPYTPLTGAPVTVSAFTDTGVINDQTYYYVVTAIDQGGASSPISTQVSARPSLLDPALEALWRLDDASGTVATEETGFFPGTLLGAPVWSTGIAGGALQFDGVNDYVQTTFTQDLLTWTVSLWVRSPAEPAAAASSGPAHRERAFQINWNHPDPRFRGAAALEVAGNWYPASFGTLAANTWHHLVATYDGEALRTYRNGVLVTQNTSPSGPPGMEAFALTLGRHARAESNFFTGTVDAVRIYSRPLSDAEILALFNSGQ
jgi:fibronectin type 3 domain-containing protein